MSIVWLTNFPVPPSVNEYLVPVASNKYALDRRGKPYQKAHFVKSDIHRQYLQRCYEWRAYHNVSFGKIQAQLHAALMRSRAERKPFALRVDHYFAFEYDRIWTVNNIAQQLDVDNRLKPCRDALAELLGIDDKYFFSGYFEKLTTRSKELECSIIRISQATPRTLAEIKAMMRKEMGT